MGRKSGITKIDLEQLKRLAEQGLTDAQISFVLKISEATLNNYKKDKKFLESLKKGKLISDAKVEESLYSRATGYSHPDVHISNYLGEITVTPITKNYPPDVTACIFWLKNRQPEKWRDDKNLKIQGDKENPLEVNLKIEVKKYI